PPPMAPPPAAPPRVEVKPPVTPPPPPMPVATPKPPEFKIEPPKPAAVPQSSTAGSPRPIGPTVPLSKTSLPPSPPMPAPAPPPSSPAEPARVSPSPPTRRYQPGATNEEAAQRLARLLVSEIKLYNEKKIEEGRKNGNIYDLLKDTIEQSRKHYKERMGEAAATMPDYFHEEMVKTLCEGDPSKLGPNYQRS
ncbi:MAG: hypothetical protein RMM17_14000, partial [Acidobacteriota bacterium]|nr:hypothetical protein [Acidobacteriota bacterium]